MALLRSLPISPVAPGPSVVRALRASLGPARRLVPRLSAVADHGRARAVCVRGAGAPGDSSPEVLGLARRGRRSRGGDRGPGRVRGRHRDMGSARTPATRRTWVRPGAGARGGGRRTLRDPVPRAAAPSGHDRSPVSAIGGGAPHSPAWCLRTGLGGPGTGAARGRRADHGGDRGGLRRGLARRGGRAGPPAYRGPVVSRSTSGTCGWGVPPPGGTGLYSAGLSPGSVVARGSSPVVDASRGRNDPRKPTLGRRAWRGLDVSPAPGDRERVGVAGSGPAGERPGRRVWGQRPGQPGEGSPQEADGERTGGRAWI